MVTLEGAIYSALIIIFLCLAFTPSDSKADTQQPIVVLNPIEYDKMRMQCREQYTYAVDLCIGEVNKLEKDRTGSYPGEWK